MHESEKKTRKTRIDKKLKSLNPPWDIIPYSDKLDTKSLTHHAVEEYPTENGPADYALFVEGKLLGIIEAKKVSLDAQNILEQAKRYSSGCPKNLGSWGKFRVPFLYSSNGEQIFFADVREQEYYSREIADFHTPDALRDMFSKDLESSRNWLKNTPNNIDELRPYQKEAIKAFEEAHF